MIILTILTKLALLPFVIVWKVLYGVLRTILGVIVVGLVIGVVFFALGQACDVDYGFIRDSFSEELLCTN